MIYCQGHWDELAAQCQRCENIHVFSLYMDGNHTYHCGKYPLTDKDAPCPCFVEREDETNG